MLYWILGLSLVILLAYVIYNLFSQQRYLKKRTSETMSSEVKKDIEEEREENLKHKEHFQEELKKAEKTVKREE